MKGGDSSAAAEPVESDSDREEEESSEDPNKEVRCCVVADQCVPHSAAALLRAQDFPNEEEDCPGPQLLHTTPLGADPAAGGGVRFILMQEDSMRHLFRELPDIPASNAELLSLFV